MMADTRQRRIMHVDMDAFFAALEQVRNPHLEARPVIVGGYPGGRGVVSTASYETRQYGVHSGMSARDAYRLCPDATFVGVDGHYYTYVSKELKKIYSDFTPRVQAASVDEAFLDITGCDHLFGGERRLALELKERIRSVSALTCSVGIAPNKILAKLASSVFKPDGLTIIDQDSLRRLVYPLPVEKIWGIGPASLKPLHRQGIVTIADLVTADSTRLRKALGKRGESLRQIMLGQAPSSVQPPEEQPREKSIGHERTFGRDVRSPELCYATLRSLADRVGRRMRRHGVEGRTVTLKYRFSDFETHTSRMTLAEATDNSHAIFTVASILFRRQRVLPRPLRLLGISMSRLCDAEREPREPDLFEPAQDASVRRSTDGVADVIRNRYGDHAIRNAKATLSPVD